MYLSMSTHAEKDTVDKSLNGIFNSMDIYEMWVRKNLQDLDISYMWGLREIQIKDNQIKDLEDPTNLISLT